MRGAVPDRVRVRGRGRVRVRVRVRVRDRVGGRVREAGQGLERRDQSAPVGGRVRVRVG